MKKKATQKEYDSFKRMAEATKELTPTTTKGELLQDGKWRTVDEGEMDVPIWTDNECICTVWNAPDTNERAQLICDAVNNYKSLLDSNRELITALGRLIEKVKVVAPHIKSDFEESILNNAKNIQP